MAFERIIGYGHGVYGAIAFDTAFDLLKTVECYNFNVFLLTICYNHT